MTGVKVILTFDIACQTDRQRENKRQRQEKRERQLLALVAIV